MDGLTSHMACCFKHSQTRCYCSSGPCCLTALLLNRVMLRSGLATHQDPGLQLLRVVSPPHPHLFVYPSPVYRRIIYMLWSFVILRLFSAAICFKMTSTLSVFSNLPIKYSLATSFLEYFICTPYISCSWLRTWASDWLLNIYQGLVSPPGMDRLSASEEPASPFTVPPG